MNNKFNKEIAVAEFNNGDHKTKSALKNIFGEKFFQPITERIDSYQAACEELGLDPDEELPFKDPKNARQEAANAEVMLDIISEALLEGKELDWTDSTQEKWSPYFNNYKSGSGFRFDVSVCGWAHTDASGGARLCVDTKEKSDYFGQRFLPIWNKFLNPKK